MAPPTYEERILRVIRRTGLIFSIIGIILLIISLLIPNDLLDFHNYKFGIEMNPSEDVLIKNYLLTYDFIKQKGSMSFYMTRSNITDYMVVRLPQETNISSVIWFNKSNNYQEKYYAFEEGIDFEGEGQVQSINPYHLFYVIRNINKTKKSYWSFVEVNFTGKLYPNAQFFIDTSAWKIEPLKGDDNGAFIKFYLGKKYSCAEKCYESFRENDIKFIYRDNQLTVATEKDKNGWKDVTYHSFNLNYNIENNNFLKWLNNISLFLISLGLIPAIEFLYLKHLKKKNRRKK